MKKSWFLFVMLIFVFGNSIGQTTVSNLHVACKKNIGDNVCNFNPGRLPQFPGGDSLLQDYLSKNLILNDKLWKKADGNIVRVQFEVDTIGKICNVVVLTEIDPELKVITETFFCNMPNWIPGGVGNSGDTDYCNVDIRMKAELRFGISSNGKDEYSFISILELPKGKIKKVKPRTQTDQVFSYAEVMPTFPGEEGAFQTYLHENIKYPIEEFNAKKQGTVYVNFVVERDGSISNVQVVKEVSGAPAFSDEAIRVISAMPNWNPGKMNGKAISVQLVQPVKFTLN